MLFYFFFFFFQAEDGIRDVAVTGVQTCALPIYATDLLVPADHRVEFPLACLLREIAGEPLERLVLLLGLLVGHALRAAHSLQRRHDVVAVRSEEHTSELQSRLHLVCRLLLEKKKA